MIEITEESIPMNMRERPRWKGLPIPFTTLIKEDGEPDFRVTDQRAFAHCLARGACAMCSKPLVYWQAFIGGDKCKETRLFFDPAMHIECAEFAARICPFIVGTKGYSKKPIEEGTYTHEIVSNERPAKMYLFKTRGYSLVKIEGNLYIKAEPFKFITELPAPERDGASDAM